MGDMAAPSLRVRRFRLRRNRPRRGDETVIAILVGLVTVTGAVASYAAVRVKSQAVEADRQAVVETVQTRSTRVSASIMSGHGGGQVTHYRVLHAQADAIEAADPREALILRGLADGLLTDQYLDRRYLTGEGVAARWQHDRNLAATVSYDEGFIVPADQPGRTAARADALHARVGHLTLTAAAIPALVLLLTVARLTAPRPRRWLLRAGAVAAGLLTALALWLALVPEA